MGMILGGRRADRIAQRSQDCVTRLVFGSHVYVRLTLRGSVAESVHTATVSRRHSNMCSRSGSTPRRSSVLPRTWPLSTRSRFDPTERHVTAGHCPNSPFKNLGGFPPF